jgi:hypothetical protein
MYPGYLLSTQPSDAWFTCDLRQVAPCRTQVATTRDSHTSLAPLLRGLDFDGL